VERILTFGIGGDEQPCTSPSIEKRRRPAAAVAEVARPEQVVAVDAAAAELRLRVALQDLPSPAWISSTRC
jgi:hypothetical protein